MDNFANNYVLALIPARSGSKGILDKNIIDLGGKPLIEWSIAACLQSKMIDRVMVSTNSTRYAEIAKKLGAEVPFLRPEEISGDKSIDYDFIIHALDFLRSRSSEPAYIVHIRPTTPFREPEIIDNAINVFKNNKNATSLRSIQPMSESAYKTFEISKGNILKQIGSENTDLDAANEARQQFPPTFVANGYVDVLSTNFVRRKKRIHGDHVIPFITKNVGEIDTEYDLQLLKNELTLNREIFTKLFE